MNTSKPKPKTVRLRSDDLTPEQYAANGFILHETKDIVVIATGFKTRSYNEKTGPMIQVYTLVKAVDPITASRTGADEAICFNCRHRGTQNLGTGKVDGRTCFVNLLRGPLGVWKAFQAGKYPKLELERAAQVFAGEQVRFGSYGETCLIPRRWFEAICGVASGWTGYTHQWVLSRHGWLKEYVMASCDTSAEMESALKLGWRVYRVAEKGARVRGEWDGRVEVNCPGSEEAGKRTQCVGCGLCRGTSAGAGVKSIFNEVHGAGASHFAILQ
jgi:hypothetical protein